MRWSHYSFLFQAEDGIRDLTVTGVQTCALPISAPSSSRTFPRRLPPRYFSTPSGIAGVPVPAFLRRISSRVSGSGGSRLQTAPPSRSEERRVGKEGRSRWSPYHYKKIQ